MSNYSLRTNEKQKALYEELIKIEPIEELSLKIDSHTYYPTSKEDIFYPIIEKHDVIMIAGAFFGDEGKGKTVDVVAHHNSVTCIARTNSGENAGHTVINEAGNRFVFNLCPSGILIEGKENYIGPECVMDPISFMENEIQQLINANIPYMTRLFVGNVHIVTPYHKLLDLILSEPNSSTLKGMAPIHASKVLKRGIRMDHIFNDDNVMRKRFEKDMEMYFGALKNTGITDAEVLERCKRENTDDMQRIPNHVMNFASATNKVEFLIDLYKTQVRNNLNFPQRCDVMFSIRKKLENGEKVLLEGPQSYWLSNAREKFWESTTSADTSALGLLATSQINFQLYRCVVINVHKTPGTSRVGIGANPSSFVPQDFFSSRGIRTLKEFPPNACVNFDAIQKLWSSSIRENGIMEPLEYTDKTGTYNIGAAMAIGSSLFHNECGAVTRKPRICGLFDCVAHYEVSVTQGPYLSINAMDRGDLYDFVGMTLAYVYYNIDNVSISCNGRLYKNGDIIHAGDPLPSDIALYHCHPIIKLFPGWKSNPIASDKRSPNDPLPDGVCQFIAAIEYFTKSVVISIGNGPHWSDVICIRKSEKA